MKTIVLLMAIGLATAASLPRQGERIFGGSVTSINNYPFAASIHASSNNVNFRFTCGSTILNNRSLLSAAHCWPRNAVASRYRIRVGSTNISSGGVMINVQQLIGHASYSLLTHDNDIGIIRVATAIPVGSASVQQGRLPPANVHIPDNSNIIAIGWGSTQPRGGPSEQLRHVQTRKLNHGRCRASYLLLTANMLCTHWSAGGRGACYGDSGTAVLFNNVVVGVTSYGRECGSSRWPDVNARVSRYINWIRDRA